MIDQRSLISVTQNTECASQRKPTTLRYCSPSPLVHDQYVRLLFHGQLNGFPFTGIEGGHQFGVGQGMERANPQPCRGLANPEVYETASIRYQRCNRCNRSASASSSSVE